MPIYKGEEQKAKIDVKAMELAAQLKALGIRVKYVDSDHSRPGWKFAEYELKGVPVRIAIGARDLENNTVELARRDVDPVEGRVDGERLLDGAVKSITADTVIFAQDVNDPLSTVKQKEVRKALRSVEEDRG